MTTYETTYVYNIHTPLIGHIKKGRDEAVRPSTIPLPAPQTAVKPLNPMLILLPIVLSIIAAMIIFGGRLGQQSGTQAANESATQNGIPSLNSGVEETKAEITGAVLDGNGRISPIFSAEVQQWAPQIVDWAEAYGLDPDIVATIMQIESCGYPEAVSSAGAQGLFQVMPFHFTDSENMRDPDINAGRGLNYYAERLQQTDGNVYLAFAGYNGGHVAAATGWDNWAAETQRYYRWSQGIYDDAKAGLTESQTLTEWMKAGGTSLCQQAASYLQLQ